MCNKVREEHDLRVDRTNHAILAMLSLRAVEPHWLCVHDANCVGQLLSGGVGCCRHKSREKGVGLVGHDILDGYARVVESGLDDGVVLLMKLAFTFIFEDMAIADIPWGKIGIGQDHQAPQRHWKARK